MSHITNDEQVKMHDSDNEEIRKQRDLLLEKEREQELFVENLMKTFNGDLCTYKVDEKAQRTIPICLSGDMGKKQGMTRDEYLSKFSENGMDTIHPDDKSRVWESICKTIHEDSATTIAFRVVNGKENGGWLNATYSKYGYADGLPVIRVLFTPVSMQYELQLHALDGDNVGVYAIDSYTKEIYYANNASFEIFGVPVCDFSGKTCYEVFFDGDKECSDCWCEDKDILNGKEIISRLKNGEVVSISIKKIIWNETEVQIVYVRNVTHIYNMQEKLLQTQAATEAACNFAGIWLWLFDIKNKCIYPSANLQKDYGMPHRMDNFPQSWFDLGFVAPECIKLHREKVQAIIDGSNQEEFECRIINKDGSEHWSRIRFKCLDDLSGYAVGISQIIDDEKVLLARVELEKKKMLSSDSTMIGYVVVNVSKDEVLERDADRNDIYLAKKGLSLSESMIKVKPFIYERDYERYKLIHDRERLLKAFNDGKTELTYEGHRVGENGNVYWVRSIISLLKNPGNGDIYLYEYIYDIHGQKMLEEIMSAAARYDYEQIASVNMRANQITVLEYETANSDIFDYEETGRKYCYRFVIEEEREGFTYNISLDNIRKELKDKDIYEFVCRTKDDDGTVRYKRMRFSYYNREMEICLITRADITDVMRKEEKDKKTLEDALISARAATKAKSEFLSRMSHEIRTPMNAIMGMTSIALENRSDFLQVTECLNKIDISSHYLLTLLNDILEMSRIESGKTSIHEEEFDFSLLMEGIRTIVETLAVQSDIRYECINKANMDYHYKGDRMRIQQVIVNIITNAIKFTKAGGRVRFTIECEEMDNDEVMFHFAVADTGIGMSEEFMSRMFKPFTQEDGSNTSKYQGSGLGLAISKSLIEIMGGNISVDSFVGIGTTFRIDLPLQRVKKSFLFAVNEHTKRIQADDSVLSGCKVLLAEDHPMNVMIAKMLLESRKMIVTVAENGKKAVEIFNASLPDYYDIILMDIRMPVMDGIEATKIIRQLGRLDATTIPIIAMTANALDEDRKRTKEAGMNEHLAKPFEPQQLFTTLKEWIQR